MTTTQNLHLPQWEDTDRIMMDDFNDAMEKIDTAVAGGVKIATGTYTGTGTYGVQQPTTFTFDSKPIVLFISSSTWQACAIQGGEYVMQLYEMNVGRSRLRWSGNSVDLYSTDNADRQMNTLGTTYAYYALLA